MKIVKIDLLHSDPVEDGWRPLFCRIYTDEGIYGDGEAALSYGGIDEAAFGMLKNMAPLLIGMDPLDHEVIWDKLYHQCFWGLNGGPVPRGFRRHQRLRHGPLGYQRKEIPGAPL